MIGLNMHVGNIDICNHMEIKQTLTDNAVGKQKGLCKLSRQQRIRGGLRAREGVLGVLRPPGQGGGLRSPSCVSGKCYGKGLRI